MPGAVQQSPRSGDVRIYRSGAGADLSERLLRENRELRRLVERRFAFGNLIGSSQPMKTLFESLELVAPTSSTVLVTGETGTGKELVARAIHYNSPRRRGPLVTVNCGAIPDSLVEAELFGHRKGAFTGAEGDRGGKFEAADGGTLGGVEAQVRFPPCPADIDDDGAVGIIEFFALLSGWGACPCCRGDIDGDGTIGITDFLAVVSYWGPCP